MKNNIRLKILALIMILVFGVIGVGFAAEAASSKVKVKLKKTAYAYSGKVIKPKVTSVKFKNKSIKKKKYSVSYQIKKNGKWKTIKAKNIKKVGTYRVVVTYKKKGKKYKGYSTFKINKKVKITPTTSPTKKPTPTPTTTPTQTPTETPTVTPSNEKKYDVYTINATCLYKIIGPESDESDVQNLVGSRCQNYIHCYDCGKDYYDLFEVGSGTPTQINQYTYIDGATVKIKMTALENFYKNDTCGHKTYTESELNSEISKFEGYDENGNVIRKTVKMIDDINSQTFSYYKYKKIYQVDFSKELYPNGIDDSGYNYTNKYVYDTYTRYEFNTFSEAENFRKKKGGHRGSEIIINKSETIKPVITEIK